MKFLFFCPRWGCEMIGWEEFCTKVKEAGYDGVETGIPFDANERQVMQQALAENELLLIGQYYQSYEKEFEEHLKNFKSHLDNMVGLVPLKIDSQTGKDYFSFEENCRLFDAAFSFSERTGIPVAHETHRNKALFAAHITRSFLEKIPQLKITADFSHWCNVSESFLEEQEEAIDLAMGHTIHIHARVGHPQGPQVTDPRLPEWENALDKHVLWWKRIAKYHEKDGKDVLTVTPEFGPKPYMPSAPRTGQPLADQWEINVWMMNFLKEVL